MVNFPRNDKELSDLSVERSGNFLPTEEKQICKIFVDKTVKKKINKTGLKFKEF